MKSIWQGSLSFGLVAIPIRLYAVAQEHVLGFKMLCKKCHTPIHLRRWCPHCKKEVSWNDVVKGIEVAKGEYVVLTQEAIKALKPTKTDSINIFSFVNKELVDPVYFNTHYYAAPATAHRAYTLLQHALGTSGRVAIGNFVMRDREHMCMIESYYTGLLLTTLYYSYEVRSAENLAVFQKKEPAVTSQELKLAKQLIDQLTKKTLDMSEYKESFAQEIKKLIKRKSKGGKLIGVEQVPRAKKTKKKELTLADELKASIHERRAVHARRR